MENNAFFMECKASASADTHGTVLKFRPPLHMWNDVFEPNKAT